ncbi:MAG: fumarylacetoacetate hydrolase family protein [Thiotrichales bacterium]
MRSIQLAGQAIFPEKIICIGRNYVAHIEELQNEIPDEMVIFLKPNSAIGDQLRSAHRGEPLHYETEIVYLVKNSQLAAVGLGLDLTKRQLQSTLKSKGLPWERAKAFDGSALFSDFIPLEDAEAPLELELTVDGHIRQSGGTQHMIHQPSDILAEVKNFMTLKDGDLIMTGTPKGVGPVLQGSHYHARLTHMGERLVDRSWTAEAC